MLKSLPLITLITILFSFPAMGQTGSGEDLGLDAMPLNSDEICTIDPVDVGEDEIGYQIGDEVPDFTLFDVYGEPFNLYSTLEDSIPVLLVSASYSCPRYRNQIPVINNLEEQFEGQLEIAIIYTVEAHPSNNPSPYTGQEYVGFQNEADSIFVPQQTTYGERVMTIQEMMSEYDIDSDIYIDGPCNPWHTNYGPGANMAYLINIEGEVAMRHFWFNLQPEWDIAEDLNDFFGEEEIEEEEEEETYGTFTFNLEDGNFVEGVAGEVLIVNGSITNPTEDPALVDIVRTNENFEGNWESAMCLDICLPAEQDTYQVYLDPGEEQDFHIYFYTEEIVGSTGEVTIEITNSSVPENTVTQVYTATTSSTVNIEESEGTSFIHAFPNPGNGILTLDPTVRQVDVYDSKGARVGSFNNLTGQIDLSSLHKGIYTLLDPGQPNYIDRIVIN